MDRYSDLFTGSFVFLMTSMVYELMLILGLMWLVEVLVTACGDDFVRQRGDCCGGSDDGDTDVR